MTERTATIAPPLFVCWLLALAVALMSMPGCGGASAQVREAYAAEVAHCFANERAIIDRAGTSESVDRADLAIERDRCDAALLAIGGAR